MSALDHDNQASMGVTGAPKPHLFNVFDRGRGSPLGSLLLTNWISYARHRGAYMTHLRNTVIALTSNQIGVVLQGDLKIRYPSYGTEEMLSTGDFFHERAVLGVPLPRAEEPPEVACVSECCRILILDREFFWESLQSVPVPLQLRIKLISDTYMRLSEMPNIQNFKNEDFVYHLSHACEQRNFEQGDHIIKEDDSDEWIGIVASGKVSVACMLNELRTLRLQELTRGRQNRKVERSVASLRIGEVFGELSAFGVTSCRTASIIAETSCTIFAIEKDILLQMLKYYPDARDKFYEECKKKLTKMVHIIPLGDISLFRGCKEEFIQSLTPMVKREVYEKNRVIFQENTKGSRLYIIQYGSVRITAKGVTLKVLRNGDFFGELCVLMDIDMRTATAVTDELSLIQYVEKNDIHNALKKYPSPLANVEMFAKQYLTGSEQNGDKDSCKSISYFQDCSPEFEAVMSDLMTDEFILPGQNIVREGDRSDSMVLLQKGVVEIIVMNAVVRHIEAPPVAVFGEFALLPKWDTRTATIQANTICWVKTINVDSMRGILSTNFPKDYAQIEKVAAQCLCELPPSGSIYTSIPLFSRSPSRFLYLLDLFAERRIANTGEVLCEETTANIPLVLILRGEAKVFKDGEHICTLQSGEVFGELKALDLQIGKGTKIVCTTLCDLSLLHQQCMDKAFQEFPQERDRLMQIVMQKNDIYKRHSAIMSANTKEARSPRGSISPKKSSSIIKGRSSVRNSISKGEEQEKRSSIKRESMQNNLKGLGKGNELGPNALLTPSKDVFINKQKHDKSHPSSRQQRTDELLKRNAGLSASSTKRRSGRLMSPMEPIHEHSEEERRRLDSGRTRRPSVTGAPTPAPSPSSSPDATRMQQHQAMRTSSGSSSFGCSPNVPTTMEDQRIIRSSSTEGSSTSFTSPHDNRSASRVINKTPQMRGKTPPCSPSNRASGTLINAQTSNLFDNANIEMDTHLQPKRHTTSNGGGNSCENSIGNRMCPKRRTISHGMRLADNDSHRMAKMLPNLRNSFSSPNAPRPTFHTQSIPVSESPGDHHDTGAAHQSTSTPSCGSGKPHFFEHPRLLNSLPGVVHMTSVITQTNDGGYLGNQKMGTPSPTSREENRKRQQHEIRFSKSAQEFHPASDGIIDEFEMDTEAGYELISGGSGAGRPTGNRGMQQRLPPRWRIKHVDSASVSKLPSPKHKKRMMVSSWSAPRDGTGMRKKAAAAGAQNTLAPTQVSSTSSSWTRELSSRTIGTRNIGPEKVHMLETQMVQNRGNNKKLNIYQGNAYEVFTRYRVPKKNHPRYIEIAKDEPADHMIDEAVQRGRMIVEEYKQRYQDKFGTDLSQMTLRKK